jgi:uncharacterized protein (DUF488 family)
MMIVDSIDVTIWTVGHSTLPIEDFLHLLAPHQIELVADVRRFPASRRHPQYNQDQLEHSLERAGVGYAPFSDLGGRREPRPDSSNTAWRNASFRGYADYMETAAFKTAVSRLATSASLARVAIMCAEGLWWRCHRSLIADYFTAAAARVFHIMPDGKTIPHPLTAAATVGNGHLSYAGDPTLGI